MDVYRAERHVFRVLRYNEGVATATQRSPRPRRGAVRLRPWNGDLSLLRGTIHDPHLSRPKVRPEERCRLKHRQSRSRVSRPQSHQVTLVPFLPDPAKAGFFYGR